VIVTLALLSGFSVGTSIASFALCALLCAVFLLWKSSRELRAIRQKITPFVLHQSRRYPLVLMVDELLQSQHELMAQASQARQVEVQTSLIEEYNKFVPRMMDFSAFMDRQFPKEMERAREQRPPVSVLEVARNLLNGMKESRL